MVTRFVKNRRDRFAMAIRHDGETEVLNNLAMTPAQMFDMAQRGLPITTRNLGVTYDQGYSNLDFVPPAEHRRGVDLADLYELRRDTQRKLRTQRDKGVFEPHPEKSVQ